MMDFNFYGDEIHLWLASLDGPETCFPSWQAFLSTDELERASRYRFERDRQRFIARRGILRQLTGQYLKIPAAQIEFTYSETGKSSIKEQSLQFNLSHSGDYGLYAFAQKRELGVDIENIRSTDDLSLIAKRFFSVFENAALLNLSDDKKIPAFYHIWTQKEAFVKALGKGLSFPLANFDVSVDPAQPGKLLSIRDGGEVGTDWYMQTFLPVEDYQAAVCYSGTGTALRFQEFLQE
jgi:4'-phosphopantetheinyl transferase